MSLSNPSGGGRLPINKWYEWSSANKTVITYDKETKKKVPSNLPFKFLVLDRVSSIKGYNKTRGCGIKSNFFRNKKDIVKIKYADNNELIIEGAYGEEDVQDKIKAKGGKYTINVFFMDSECKISVLQLNGCAVAPFFDFSNGTDLTKSPLAFISGSKYVKPDQGPDFNRPIFGSIPEIKKETLDKAIELDKQLQLYFNQGVASNQSQPIADISQSESIENMDFPDASQLPQSSEPEPQVAEDDDLPF